MPYRYSPDDMPLVHVSDAKNRYRRISQAIRSVRDLGIEFNVQQARMKVDQAKHDMMGAALDAATQIVNNHEGTDVAYEKLRQLSKQLSRAHLIENQNGHLGSRMD